MKYQFHDGGRAAAGFKGSTRDCVCRAIAIATGESYATVYSAINAHVSGERRSLKRRGHNSARGGVQKDTIRAFMAARGWSWVPTMAIGQGCTVHLRDGELPAGRLVVSVSRHLVAVVDGVVFDTSDPTRDGSRCVYGYWHNGAVGAPVTRCIYCHVPNRVGRTVCNSCGEPLAGRRGAQ